mgnify:CR=1 FL=1|jgi:hypothetical protein
MPNEKKDASVSPTDTPNIVPIPIIQQTPDKSTKKHRGKCLSIKSSVHSAALKIYDDQLVYGWDYTKNAIKTAFKSSYMQIEGIKHYKDYLDNSDFWVPSIEKPHYHIIFRLVDRKNRIRIGTVLKALGIEFRKGLDDNLLREHGCETVQDFSAYSLYLTHETEDAILDGKSLYDISDIVSNLTESELEQIREGYVRPSEKRRLTQAELISLDQEAYNKGYELKDFDDWYNSLGFVVRSNAKMKVIKESYSRGVESRIKEGNSLPRLCIFIQGAPNTGKTYAAAHSVKGDYLSVGGGGSGKFDNLKPSHNAIIIDDDVCPNLLNMSDNYICKAYRRNKNNPVWAGEYLIITSNLSFDEWASRCGIDMYIQEPAYYNNYTPKYTEHGKALRSRFYICELRQTPTGQNRLACLSASNRGTLKEQFERAYKFVEFQNTFNGIIANYNPQINKVDYSKIEEK